MAQFAAGETVVAVAGQVVATWQDVRWKLVEHAQQPDAVPVEVQTDTGELKGRRLDLSGLKPDQVDVDILDVVGLTRGKPRIEPVVTRVVEDGAGARGGLRQGDRIIAIEGGDTVTFEDVIRLVRTSPDKPLRFFVRARDGTERELTVVPDRVQDGGKDIGRMGVEARPDEAEMARYYVDVRYSVLAAVGKGVERTWETSVFSLRMLGKMVLGQISLRNISGPITIADYAGQSAQIGPVAYLNFIALISISLGVLNLLPVPLLDGGHLMYYCAEVLKGSPVSERVMEIGQQVGMVLLFTLMAFALYNDVHRLLGG
jgi:regulator of sigma E protease